MGGGHQLRAKGTAAYFLFSRGLCFTLRACVDFCGGGADFEPACGPFVGGGGASCLGGADDLAGLAAESPACAPFFIFSGLDFSGFFFSSIFLGGSLMPASLRKTLAWSSGLRALPRSCAWKKSSRTLSNFGPRSSPMASSSPATPGNALRRGFHLNI